MRDQFGLIGRKLGHSDSVPIHRKFGLTNYALFELEPEEIPAFLNRKDLRGLNVTIPYKRAVIPYLDKISPFARAVGCVNTVVFEPDGRKIGYNTDVAGFIYMLRRLGADALGAKALVFGSGGGGAAAKQALLTLGAGNVEIISRSGENNYQNLNRHGDAELLVNATPVGMFPNTEGAVVDPSAFPRAKAAVDLIYNPCRTDFLLRAAEAGLACANGLSMLVAQAKAAERLFLGETGVEEADINDPQIGKVVREMARETTSLALVGMPGAGKSAIGRKLGEITGREVLETDEMVERSAGKSAARIIREDGERAFREWEARAVREASFHRGAVIVTGGGAVLREENRKNLRRAARVYRIQRDLSLLPREGRPLSEGANLSQMASEREPFYAAAMDAQVFNQTAIETAADAIWRDFCAKMEEKA